MTEEKNQSHEQKNNTIRNLYLYGISGIALLVAVFGWGHFVTEILYNIFDLREEWDNTVYYKRNLIGTAVTSSIATALFVYHWRIIKKGDK